ncbi:MAG: enoyl-CoA hydratase/isomerase family protein [Candidatus Binatia bacterium]
MNYQAVIFEKKEGIAYVTLNRPEVMNARNRQMREEIIHAMTEIRHDPEIRVAILTGAGERSFSAGRDLKEAAQEERTIVESRQQKLERGDTETIANLNKPIIAAINGYALGGGCEMALACDIRVAVEDAKLGFPEVSRGMIPGSGGTQRLSRLVGLGKALELILTGATIDAHEALRIGLVNKTVARPQLMAAAEEYARMIVSRGPLAVIFAKEAIRKGHEMRLEDGLCLETNLSSLLQTTEDIKEGARAFVEKRAPQFKGR